MEQYFILGDYPNRIRQLYGSQPLVHYQPFGGEHWVTLSGSEFSDACLAAGRALAQEGVSLTQRVGIYSPNSLEGVTTELGLFMMRAVAVPLYATSTPEQVEYIVQDAEIALMFVGEQFQYNNAYEVQRRGGHLQKLVIFDPNVVLHPEDKTSVFYGEWVRRADAKQYENIANVTAAQTLLNDLAVIIYTSGTSGQNKGVPLRHSHFSAQMRAHLKMFTFLSPADISMSFLPHSHIFEKAWIHFCLTAGIQIAILRDPKKILQALPQIRPTIMCNVPRFWEKVYAGVQEKISQTSPFGQRIMRHAIRTGERYRLEYVNKGIAAPLHLKLMYKLYERTLFAKVKRVLGLDRGRFFPTAGASLSVEVNRFLQSLGIPICFGYGLSESTATVCCFPQQGFDIHSIGQVVEHVEVRIDPETSEIQLRGDSIITEYYNNPTANAESFTPDGFFRTGDAGRYEGGNLYFTERLKDLFKTANGKYIAPQMLEGLLAIDPLFEQVAIIGDGHKFVSALIYPNWVLLRKELELRGVQTEGVEETDLVSHPEAERIVMAHVEKALGSVAQYEKVKRFRLLPRPFTMEAGELTPTLKIKRRVVAERYADLIAQMYAE